MRAAVAEVVAPLAAKGGVGIRHDAQRTEQHEQNLRGGYSLCAVHVWYMHMHMHMHMDMHMDMDMHICT